MSDFLWKLAGANVAILRDCNSASQSTFSLIGKIFLFIIIYVFIALAALFSEISKNIIVGIILSSALTFLICNIYFINMLDLEPHTLPRKEEEKKSLVLAYIIRFLSVAIFSLFAIKSMEVFLFKHLLVINFHGNQIINELVDLHKKHPEIWLFTFLSFAIFLSPIYLKYQLNKKGIENNKQEKSYYQIKREVDIYIVQKEYQLFIKEKNKLISQIYRNYDKLNALYCEVVKKNPSLSYLSHQYRKRNPKAISSKFEDAPFNTKLKKVNEPIRLSHEDFLKSEGHE